MFCRDAEHLGLGGGARIRFSLQALVRRLEAIEYVHLVLGDGDVRNCCWHRATRRLRGLVV